jgi:hypothetical protein
MIAPGSRILASVLGAAASLLVSAGCVNLGTPSNDPNAAFDPQNLQNLSGGTAESAMTFQPVAVYLSRRCGSLDCHGEPGRNLRLYGQFGLRYTGDGSSNVPGGDAITTNEIIQDWLSIVYLEPEIMDQVVGRAQMDPTQLDPSPLTFYRKPTGLEAHKGGQLITPATQMQPGDDQDTCIRSWLAGMVNADECKTANDITLYP